MYIHVHTLGKYVCMYEQQRVGFTLAVSIVVLQRNLTNSGDIFSFPNS